MSRLPGRRAGNALPDAPENSPPPGPPPWGPGPRRPPPPDPVTRQRGWAALTLGVLSVIGLFLVGDPERAVYLVIVTLLIGATAAWLGVSAGRRAARTGTARPHGAIAGTVLGGIGVVFSVLLLVVFAVFWRQLSTYSSCLSGANTLSAQQACRQQLTRSIDTEIKALQPNSR